jgi:kynureninase
MSAATAPAPPRDYRAEFPIFRHSVYLNTCSLGALSVRSRARVNQFLDLWEQRGAAAWYDLWWEALASLRERYGRLIGAPPGTIALHPNISTALRTRTAARQAERSAIVMLASDDPPGDVRRLADAAIIADARLGHVRLSPYFYNVAGDYRAAIERLTRD